MSRLQDVLLQGLAADRPAASDVGKGTLYFSTDSEITEQSDGTTWSPYSGTSGSAGITSLSGDVIATGPGAAAATLANTAVTPGSYTNTNLTVDAKGRITAAANGSGGSGSPGGADTDVQFNDSGAFGGTADFTFNKTTKVANITNALSIGASPASTGALRLPNNTSLIARNAGGSGDISVASVDASDIVRIGNTGNNTRVTGLSRTATFIIDGAGATITTGVKGDLRIPIACTIVKATLLADQSGSIVVNIWKDSYANYPPTVADKITASAPPTISSADKSEDSTLTGWTTTINAGDTLRINVDSATTIQRVTLILDLRED